MERAEQEGSRDGLQPRVIRDISQTENDGSPEA